MYGLLTPLMLFSGFLTGDKADLILPPPGLTRYKKEVAIKASKKKGGDPRDPDERRSSEINMLTTATLCIRLNTLHYILSHVDLLEDNIQDRWAVKRPQDGPNRANKSLPSKLSGFMVVVE
jgi:hypothetical protein